MPGMHLQRLAAFVVFTVGLCGAAGAAPVQPRPPSSPAPAPTPAPALAPANEQPAPSTSAGSWTTTFAGGALWPLQAMETTHQQSLAAGLRIGYTSPYVVGIDLALDYAPLSRLAVSEDESFQTHFASAQLMPKLSVGRGVVRLWLGAGGGYAVDRTTATAGDAATTTEYAPIATAAAGLELHVVTGAGLAVIGSYSRLFGQLEYQYATAVGGLIFEF